VDWTAKVVRFAESLRRNGVDAELDLWHESDTGTDWTRWGQQQIADSEFVVVALSTAWKQRWEGSESPTVGAGATAEANALKGIFQANRDDFQNKVLLALLPGVTQSDVPYDLFHLYRVEVPSFDVDGLESLLRSIFKAPTYSKPPLGDIPEFASSVLSATPSVETATLSLANAEAQLAASADVDRPALRRQRTLRRGLVRGLAGREEANHPSSSGIPVAPIEQVVEPPTAEQQALLRHPVDRHGVVLAGPGTGKSTTVLQLAALLRASAEGTVRMITFTRAATAELADKIRTSGHEVDEPTTVHAFALSILMRHPDKCSLPMPLRIPDSWELRQLVQPDLARRLTAYGHPADSREVSKLMAEMAAGWESMDPAGSLQGSDDPALRNAFRAAWQRQRTVFGYTLFAEMTFEAAEMLQDLDRPSLGDLKFLIIDEYQDLNRADIAMIEALALHDVSVLAVGDDDQSIYGFRHAAPQGIREFAVSGSFPGAISYSLSESRRLGGNILAAATELIESSPTRQPKQSLHPASSNPPGEIGYLRFANNQAEVAGVVRLIKSLIGRGVTPDQILVLFRGDHNGAWSRPLREALERDAIPVSDVEGALSPLQTNEARRLLALARLMGSDDDLSWWTLLKLTNGVSDQFCETAADEAADHDIRFAQYLTGIIEPTSMVGLASTTTRSRNAAKALVSDVHDLRGRAVDLAGPDVDAGETWSDWLTAFAQLAGVEIAPDLAELLTLAAEREPVEEGLDHFLGSLDRIAGDIALEEPAVSLMTMSKSKGLTREATFVVGVEEGVIPRGDSTIDVEEERRLLYVAMTRARRHLFLTMVQRRVGPTARSGKGASGERRVRSPFFRGARLKPEDGAAYIQGQASG
jgi:DNA helicase-2/ATP-dependent DNA helicase PcrA